MYVCLYVKKKKNVRLKDFFFWDSIIMVIYKLVV